MKPPPTHAMIAAACGVNVSTVSRALNNNPVIPEVTRQKIRAQAEAMGWKVNPLVSAYMAHLRSNRKIPCRANLAYVIPHPAARKIEDVPGYHQEHYRGCREQAAGLGFGVEPIWFPEWGGQGEKLSRLLRNRGIPAAIFHGFSVTRELYENFDWSFFAAAAWGAAGPDFALHRAGAHYHHDMQLALSRIRSYGYRRIALMLNETQDDLSEHSFYASFLYSQAFDCSGLDFDYLKLPDDTEPEIRKRLAKDWLVNLEPDLVIGEQITWELLSEMRWLVPQRIGFVSLFWSPGWPQIGGVDQQAETIGRNTIDLVVGQLVRNERGLPRSPKLLLSRGTWVDGPSCPDRGGGMAALQEAGPASRKIRSRRPTAMSSSPAGGD